QRALMTTRKVFLTTLVIIAASVTASAAVIAIWHPRRISPVAPNVSAPLIPGSQGAPLIDESTVDARTCGTWTLRLVSSTPTPSVGSPFAFMVTAKLVRKG